MWPGFSVCLPFLSPNDLPEKAGAAPLAVSPLPQFPDPAGHGQPAGSVPHVEKQSEHRHSEPFWSKIKKDVMEISDGNL